MKSKEPPKPRRYEMLRARGMEDERFARVSDFIPHLERIRAQCGTWRVVAERARVSTRWIRMLRSGRFKCVGLTVLERMLINLGHEEIIGELTWFTMDELIAKGMWQPVVTPMDPEEVKRRRREYKKKRERKKRRGELYR